jgi:acyl carrier protein
MDRIEPRIREIVTNVSGVSSEAPGSADLYLDLGVASVHALKLLTELEQSFGITIPDEDFVDATSIDKLVALTTRLVKGAKETADA